MGSILVRPKARADLKGIWAYTRTEWSEGKADEYLAGLRRCLETLAEWTEGGTDCGYIRAGYRKYPCHHHVIFYRLTADGIEVVRVLHESMDVESQL
jgi:toxin ParE1/3/4